MTDDLISRQAALDALGKDPMGGLNYESILKRLPSAQPKRIRGKWIGEGYYADGHGACVFRCSECGGHIIEYDVDPFCRWCGADMRGEENERHD